MNIPSAYLASWDHASKVHSATQSHVHKLAYAEIIKTRQHDTLRQHQW